MDLLNNTAAFNDTAGVLPMDTGATVNGIHDESENTPSSSANAGNKKGRGRPPKSAGSTKKVVHNSDTTKRARGRPPKAAESPSAAKVASVPIKTKEVASTNGKRRGRPSKTSPSNEKTNGISKPQVQAAAPVINHQEKENVAESEKKKRGRPSGSAVVKAPVVAAPAPKQAASTKKRGRPSGSASGKKSASKPKATTSGDGSGRKRGRPKKSAGSSPTGGATTSTNESATATPNNVQ